MGHRTVNDDMETILSTKKLTSIENTTTREHHYSLPDNRTNALTKSLGREMGLGVWGRHSY